ncbi:MAG: alpha/beta hydrolase [Granulosicoccus sp.]
MNYSAVTIKPHPGIWQSTNHAKTTLPVERANEALKRGDINEVQLYVDDAFDDGSPDPDDIPTLLAYEKVVELVEKINLAKTAGHTEDVAGILESVINIFNSLDAVGVDGAQDMADHYSMLRMTLLMTKTAERATLPPAIAELAEELAIRVNDSSDIPISDGNQALKNGDYDSIISYVDNRLSSTTQRYLSNADQTILLTYKHVAMLAKESADAGSFSQTARRNNAESSIIFSLLDEAGVDGAGEMSEFFSSRIDYAVVKHLNTHLEAYLSEGSMTMVHDADDDSPLKVALESIDNVLNYFTDKPKTPDHLTPEPGVKAIEENAIKNKTVGGNKVSSLTSDVPFSADLKMDIYQPANPDNNKIPVVINLVGGGWSSAEKDHPSMQAMGNDFANNGIAMISPEYHTAPSHTYPTQMQDIDAVLMYVKDHAEENNWDLDNITLAGGSAGGHLVLQHSMNPEFDNNPELPKVKNVIAIAPATDLTIDVDGQSETFVSDFLGTENMTDEQEAAIEKEASPTTYVTEPNDKRFYFSYGLLDTTTSADSQALPFIADMESAGQDITVDAHPEGKHGDWLVPNEEHYDSTFISDMAQWIKAA